jgi:hypothetical protein
MNETYFRRLQSTSKLTIPSHNELEESIHYIYMIIYPVIFVTGLVGNLFSSLLFSITDLSQTSCGIYFILLAVFDLIALISGLHHCLTIGYHIPVPNALYCRARNFLLYTSMDMVSWMIVAISVDRFLKVKYPLRARVYCTQKLSMIVSCVLATILILKNIHLSTVFIGDFTDDTDDNCDPNPAYPTYVSFFKNIWPWIDLVTFALLPVIIITSSNIFIISYQYKRRLKFGFRNLDRSLTKFLLISSVSFIVCNFPVSITIVIYPYISTSNGKKEYYDKAAFIFDLLRLLSYASLAFNFYLYYYSSSIFRQQVINLSKRIFRMSLKSDQGDIHEHKKGQVRGQLNLCEESEEK